MPGKIFFDTNCLIYLMSEDEPEKKDKMRICITSTKERLISTQVLRVPIRAARPEPTLF